MPVSLKLVSNDGGPARTALAGEVRHSDAKPGSPNPFREALGDGWAACKVMIDLTGVTQVDSAAVGWLMSSAAHFKRAGGGVVLHSVAPMVHQMFKFMNMQRIIPIVADEQAARQALAIK